MIRFCYGLLRPKVNSDLLPYAVILADPMAQHTAVKITQFHACSCLAMPRRGILILFMIDPAVAFDNNMSERDLRGVKGKSKSCGGFRSSTGLDIICDVMSIVGTCKRRGMPILQTIRSIVQSPKDVFALAG